MGIMRAIAIRAQQQALKKKPSQNTAQQTKLQGTAQQVENQAGLIRDKYNVGPGGETTSFNAGLLTLKRGRKEALKDYNFSMVDEHQGQIFLG